MQLPAINPADHVEVVGAAQTVELGQWYWVNTDKGERLACVMEIGSNYVGLKRPAVGGGSYSYRVHFDDFWTELRREHDAQSIISGYVSHHTELANEHLKEINAITARLGVSKQAALPGAAGGSANALAVVTGTADVKAYERALVVAKEQTLPELFSRVKHENKEVARWMTASTLPLLAQSGDMEKVVDSIKDRIFSISLYAGLAEQSWLCCDGEPAAFHEKLYVFQRRLYMDEECLLNYRTGGMDFNGINEFDAWIALPENRDRILPKPRCMVAMRVRRHTKHRTADSLATALINIKIEEADKLTFLYIRNGERVHCLQTDLEFDEELFPSPDEFDPGEPQMFKMFGNRVEKVITRARYEEMVAEDEARKLASAQWEKDNPREAWDEKKDGYWSRANPHRDTHHRLDDWMPLDPSSVYFDEAKNDIEQRIRKYNRVATIIQGLFDRSDVLHPHPPVKTWTADGFDQAIELVYDGSWTLASGEAPDFEAYRTRCNATLHKGSVVVGQEDFWERLEGERESARRDRDWRAKSDCRPDRYRPYGNPGPGFIQRIGDWRPKARTAVFRWDRKRIDYSRPYRDDGIACTLTVPADELFNIDAYKPGDYKQFFQDHRTRAQYIKWAHLLLSAEEYHAGNLKVAGRSIGDDE